MPRLLFALAGLMSATAVAFEPRADQSPGTPEQVSHGKEKFATCAGCHGEAGEGRVGMGPRLNSSSYLAIVSNDFISRTIREGRPGTNMISWASMMNDEDIAGLVAYIRSWQADDGVQLNDAPLTGTADAGQKLYMSICSRCHGRSGAGYSEAGSGTGIGRKAFLDQASDGMLRAVIAKGKDNTAMRPFDEKSPVAVANLSPDEIDSIIKYLRANAW